MNSKWQINRVGLLDFWYYDEEEFDFLDGRMLLRGANGSGKSVTMQSFIPASAGRKHASGAFGSIWFPRQKDGKLSSGGGR